MYVAYQTTTCIVLIESVPYIQTAKNNAIEGFYFLENSNSATLSDYTQRCRVRVFNQSLTDCHQIRFEPDSPSPVSSWYQYHTNNYNYFL